jgi:hypothetical protein
MRAKGRVRYRGLALLIAFSLAAGVLSSQDAARTKEQTDDAVALKEFTGCLNEYLKLRKTIEKQLPAMKSTEELPEMIGAHQQALARKIREARPYARPGDIFTRATREAFRHVIHSVFQDPQTATATAHATIRQRKTLGMYGPPLCRKRKMRVTGWSAQMYTAFVGVDHSWPGWNAMRSFPIYQFSLETLLPSTGFENAWFDRCAISSFASRSGRKSPAGQTD